MPPTTAACTRRRSTSKRRRRCIAASAATQRALGIELDTHLILLWTGQARLALARQQAWLESARLGAVGDAGADRLAPGRHPGLSRRVRRAALTAGQALEALLATDMMAINLASTIHLIADVQRRCGRWDEALRVIEETRERVAEQGDTNQRVAETLAAIYLDLGRPDLAHRRIEAFAAAAQTARMRERTLVMRWSYGLATGARIETSEALARTLASENLLLGCELMLTAGRAERAGADGGAVRRADRALRARGLREQLVPLHALHAWLAARAGDVDARRWRASLPPSGRRSPATSASRRRSPRCGWPRRCAPPAAPPRPRPRPGAAPPG